MANIVIEYLVQEIPAAIVKEMVRDMDKFCHDYMATYGYTLGDYHIYNTPRRLSLSIDNIPLELVKEHAPIKGPSCGAPSQAIEGFCKKHGVNIDDLQVQNTTKGDVYMYQPLAEHIALADALKAFIPSMIQAWNFKKSMRFGAESHYFIRPLDAVFLMIDGMVVEGDITLYDTTLSLATSLKGHRFLSSSPITLDHADDYLATLRQHSVVVHRGERLAMLRKQCAALELPNIDASAIWVDPLIDEWLDLVEYPQLLCGTIDDEFLTLPSEVLELSMRKHQKYLALYDTNGAISRYFLFASNMPDDGVRGTLIVQGNQRVLRARLQDALFFLEQDKAISLAEWSQELQRVTFIENMGTLYDKADRIYAIMILLNNELNLTLDEAIIKDIAYLSKADLCTFMVGEFPELQAIMGGYYAPNDIIGRAIRYQYNPHGRDDTLPTFEPYSFIMSLADKCDNLLVISHAMGLPSGSKDPYQLRRHALGIIRLLIEYNIDIELTKIIDNVSICAFISTRMQHYLRDNGIAPDITMAVSQGSHGLSPYQLYKKAHALNNLLTHDDGINLKAAYKRAANILHHDSASDYTWDNAAVTCDEETILYTMLHDIMPAIDTALQNHDYEQAIEQLASVRGALDIFFDSCKIMDDDARIKHNRCYLLQKFISMVALIADFSLLQG